MLARFQVERIALQSVQLWKKKELKTIIASNLLILQFQFFISAKTCYYLLHLTGDFRRTFKGEQIASINVLYIIFTNSNLKYYFESKNSLKQKAQ